MSTSNTPCRSEIYRFLCFQLANAVGEDIVREELANAFVQLLKDNEAEVRTAAAGQIPGKAYSIPLLF